jgi:hypothetical protein
MPATCSAGRTCPTKRCPPGNHLFHFRHRLTTFSISGRPRRPGQLQRVVGTPNPPPGATNAPLRWQGLSPLTSPSQATPRTSKLTLALQPSTPRAMVDPSLTHLACTPPAPDLPPIAALQASQTGPHDPSGRRPQTTTGTTRFPETPPAGKGQTVQAQEGSARYEAAQRPRAQLPALNNLRPERLAPTRPLPWSAAASCSAAQIRLSMRESSAPIAPSHQSAIPTLRARSSPFHQLRLLAYLPNLAGDGRPEPDLLGEPRAPQPPLSIPTCSPSCRLTRAAGNATRQRPGTSMSARLDTRRPNGPELSCPAARATPHTFSRILAGTASPTFRTPAGSAAASC